MPVDVPTLNILRKIYEAFGGRGWRWQLEK